ncbi:hypothetical protein GOODEAATRI_016874, partial [Goodea atripinnis]
AAFFVTYESTKSLLVASTFAASHVAPVSHMLAASLGEIVNWHEGGYGDGGCNPGCFGLQYS